MAERLTPYQRRLFVFLSVATFFEGYDFLALSQLLPTLKAEMGFGRFGEGALVATINVGTVIAYLLVRQADRWGRKRVLSVTILGYAVSSFASGLAPNVVVFALLQLVARVFLIGEWAISMVYAAEEFPAARRGVVIGVIQAFSSLGAIVCAGLVPLLIKAPWGWRTVYFVGSAPLLLMAVARRGLRETARFTAEAPAATPILRIFATSYRRRMLQLAAIWALTYVCTQNAITFWKVYQTEEAGLDEAKAGGMIAIASLAAMPLVFAVGKLLDVAGRRASAVIVIVLTALGVVGSYQLPPGPLLLAALTLGIFGVSAVLPVLNAYTTELFPTELRGDAFAWSNNLLGRIGYVLSPLAIGAAASSVGRAAAVSATAVFPVIALFLILAWLPETRGRELEETSRA